MMRRAEEKDAFTAQAKDVRRSLDFNFKAETHIFCTGIAAYAHAAAGPE